MKQHSNQKLVTLTPQQHLAYAAAVGLLASLHLIMLTVGILSSCTRTNSVKLNSFGHCGEDLHIAIGENRVVMHGLTVRGNQNEFIAIDLGMEADPDVFTPELIAAERRRLPGWRFQKEYMRNWDAQTGAPVFEPEWIQEQEVHRREPKKYMDLHTIQRNGISQRDALGMERMILVEKPKGRLRVYITPDETAGHALTLRNYGIGMDVGAGVEKSDSTIQVMSSHNREQAACLACNTIRPSELGRFAAVVGEYYNKALICCVSKMHGLTALRAIADVGYPRIWRTTTPRKGMMEAKTKNLGWPGAELSGLIMGRWIDALGTKGLVMLHDLETIHQHRQYVFDEHGRVCHQRLRSEPVDIREKHGDLVVAASLAYRAVIDIPKYARVAPDRAPEGSPAARSEKRRQAKKRETQGKW